ncbi:MAG TPA: nucleoside triphosphate pyrophosphohydrolase [Candidatus Limnocylindrales bacterium]|nr:nucleoside triphosphate pyrophosphohydrolase [Candidatus Limnocylindrales bacterium]
MIDELVREARRRWSLDPAGGFAIVSAERLVATAIDPTRVLVIAPSAELAGQTLAEDSPPLPGRAGPAGRDPVALLRRLYPADHPVGRFGAGDGLTVEQLSAEDLARPLFLGPIPAEDALASPWGMPAISERLRRPDGCPWDREQTHLSLRNHLLEEAYEVYDAISDPATPALADELGDLWLQVVLHAQLAAEEGVFDLADVQAAIASKIVRRHPHVFGEVEARTASDVNRQWERIKAAERAAIADGQDVAGRSALDGISRSLPALAASQEMQERASNIGYDWPSIEGVLAKVEEEVGELRAASNPAERAEELGDLLFVLVNVARRLGLEAEGSLRAANDKFRRRFGVVERLAAEREVALRDLSFEQLDELWDRAKQETAMTETLR